MKYEIQSACRLTTPPSHQRFIGDWMTTTGIRVTPKHYLRARPPCRFCKQIPHMNTPGGDGGGRHHSANQLEHQATGSVFEALVTAAFSAGTIITSACKSPSGRTVLDVHNPWSSRSQRQ